MNIDETEIKKHIKIKDVDFKKDKVRFTVNTEELKEYFYNKLKIQIYDNTDKIILDCDEETFLTITPTEIMDKNYCKQLAKEIQNTLNNRIKSKLNMK